MTIKIIKSQLEDFFSNDIPEVLAISGKWGVGKTHFWNDTLKAANAAKKIILPRYAYISLFGISSLEKLRNEMFTQIIDCELIGKELTDTETIQNSKLSSLKSFSKRLGGQTVSLIADQILKNSSSIVDSLCFSSINKTLFCLDDLERRSKSMDLQDLLGLVSFLKEQKKCKVVLLLNDGEAGLEDYKKFHEKVVDRMLTFAPTAKECAEIAIPDSDSRSTKFKELLQSLNITNIRTIKKIKRFVELVTPLLKEFEPEILDQAVHSITLFGWCHYRADDSEIPTLDHVTHSKYALLGFGNDEELPDTEKKWNAKLRDYGYQVTDELDLLLMKGVCDGYFTDSEVKEAASKQNTAVIAARSSGSFSDAWKCYHDNFDDNQSEVISTLFQSFKVGVKHISPANLNGMISLFRQLGENNKADEAIDFYVQARQDERELFDLSNYPFVHDITDQAILDRFASVYKTSIEVEPIEDVLKRIVSRGTWKQSDEVLLANISVEAYYRLFKNETGEQHDAIINACLRFGNFSNPDEHKKAIIAKATEALEQIASESTLNRLRVKKYGITFNDSLSSKSDE